MPNTRRLSPRELATIRAALTLWVWSTPDAIPDDCRVDVDGVGLLSDAEIEQLLADLAIADDVTVGGATT